MWLRVCPPMLVKSPPAKILPSACTAIDTDTYRSRSGRTNRQAGRGIEPGDAVARLSADAVRVKSPPTKILPSACTAIAIDNTVRVRVEGGVERAVRVQPGNAVARDRRSAVGRERGKIAADKNLAVRLDDDDVNRAVRVRIETVERGLPAHLAEHRQRSKCDQSRKETSPFLHIVISLLRERLQMRGARAFWLVLQLPQPSSTSGRASRSRHLEQFEPPVAGRLPRRLSSPKAGVNAPGYNSGNCAASGKSSGAKRTPTPSRRTALPVRPKASASRLR